MRRNALCMAREPLNDYAGKVKLGSQLAVSYAQIR
jgi:hypothetical protein